MHIAELRALAREARAELPHILDGEADRVITVMAALDAALAIPSDAAAERALRVAFARDPRLLAWLRDRSDGVREWDRRILYNPDTSPFELRDLLPTDPTPPPPPARYLHGELPDQAEPGQLISLRVAVAGARLESTSAALIDLPAGPVTVTITVSTTGLIPQGDTTAELAVSAEGESAPHLFTFRAGPVGLHRVRVEAYHRGTYLGVLRLEVSVGHDGPAPRPSERAAELATVAFEPGEVTLQVRRTADGYTFQLLGDALYDQVTAAMGDPTAQVDELATELRLMAAGQSPYAGTEGARRRLRALGAALWGAAVPQRVQEQFWEQADRIRMFTIAADRDTIPWELLHPVNGPDEIGFLAERFPVVRRAYDTRRVTTLPMDSAAYVVPPGSPYDADQEVSAIRRVLGPRVADRGKLGELLAVQDMLDESPGIVHFACHNAFSDAAGSRIELTGGPWRPTDLALAVQRSALTRASPLVFLNACRSAGEADWFSRMSGWAGEFMRAGAGAFIGSLWAVRSSSATVFAEAFYQHFAGESRTLGEASLLARRAIAEDAGDPTWLAYTVYGNPAATAAPRP